MTEMASTVAARYVTRETLIRGRAHNVIKLIQRDLVAVCLSYFISEDSRRFITDIKEPKYRKQIMQ